MQLLFQRDHNPTLDRSAIDQFVQDRIREPELRTFCMQLYEGVTSRIEDLDSRLSAAADNWRLPRMAGVDRNALRIGAFELLHTPETPPSVAIDESIELARRFGSADSPAFVNGVLDRLRQDAVPRA
jgi:N utilization substance protein B